MNIIHKPAVLAVLSAFIAANQIIAQNTIDLKKIIAASDLTYDKPVSRSEEGMPVGNGRMGCQF